MVLIKFYIHFKMLYNNYIV